MLSLDCMFEKLQIREKIHDAPRQPGTCSHPIYARTLTGICQAIRIFLPAFFMYLYPCDQECIKSVIVALSFYCTARLSMHTCQCSHLAV